MTERLQKILSGRGVASRRAAEKLITDGRVSVNGRVALLGESADPDVDEILLDGRPLPSISQSVYILLHKPRGYVTTVTDDRGRKTVMELVADCPARVYPVGRLDMDSEGLLLLTNDGDFANALMHPKHNVDKTYEVWITGYHNAALSLLARPITLDGYAIRKPEVKLLWEDGGKAKLLVTIHEGRNRQIRRMCEAANLRVTRLRRISEGSLKLGDLPLGKWRYLTKEEIESI
ncbi:MAG: rRNA pseudouridine synthase [Oscillospiraceae bacterium]|nr:rRNA pseudouridine synthase [Oscillospiraceae bacterium]